jgi:hypothetical protein
VLFESEGLGLFVEGLFLRISCQLGFAALFKFLDV